MREKADQGQIETPPPLSTSLFRIAVRLLVIVAFTYGVHLLMNWVLAKADTLSPGSQTFMLNAIVALVLLAYATLIAIPFVPGIEIGVALIVMRGPPIVPYVFSATVTGLVFAYLVGRFIPHSWLRKTLLDLRLVRANTLLEQVQAMPSDTRINIISDRLPAWLGPRLVRWRYLALGLLFNIPGNALIGGGGGIAMVAGFSRVFRPLPTILTIVLAVSPVPLLVWLFGIEPFV